LRVIRRMNSEFQQDRKENYKSYYNSGRDENDPEPTLAPPSLCFINFSVMVPIHLIVIYTVFIKRKKPYICLSLLQK
jgi:hypothetical protein